MEIWKDIPGYEGLYQVSNEGRVKTARRKGTFGGLARMRPMQHGYIGVDLCREGKRKTHMVHRLVAQAFISNPDNLPEINHKDENKTNNHANNLEWCTRRYNLMYGEGHKRRVASKSKPVTQHTKNGEFVAWYPSVKEAGRQTGVYDSNIGYACRHNGTAGGYIWRYYEGA